MLGFLESVAQLIESLLGVKDELLQTTCRCILFDFNIWYRADVSVQIALTQLLHPYIKDDIAYFHEMFGIAYFIRAIEQFHNSANPDGNISIKESRLTEVNKRDLRMSLLGWSLKRLKWVNSFNPFMHNSVKWPNILMSTIIFCASTLICISETKVFDMKSLYEKWSYIFFSSFFTELVKLGRNNSFYSNSWYSNQNSKVYRTSIPRSHTKVNQSCYWLYRGKSRISEITYSILRRILCMTLFKLGE